MVEAVRSFTELLLYGESRGDERMFEFFGHRNLLLLFCHMVSGFGVMMDAALDMYVERGTTAAPHRTHLIQLTNQPHTPTKKAREPRPAVQTTVLGALGLLLYNTRRDEALHYLLSQNYLNDLLASLDAAALAAGGEEVGLIFGPLVCLFSGFFLGCVV